MSSARDGSKRPPPRPREGTGWAVMSYLIGGMALYGGIGWLIGRWTHISVLFPIGMLLGMALAGNASAAGPKPLKMKPTAVKLATATPFWLAAGV